MSVTPQQQETEALERRFIRLLRGLYGGRLGEAYQEVQVAFLSRNYGSGSIPPLLRRDTTVEEVDFSNAIARERLLLAVLLFLTEVAEPRFLATVAVAAAGPRGAAAEILVRFDARREQGLSTTEELSFLLETNAVLTRFVDVATSVMSPLTQDQKASWRLAAVVPRRRQESPPTSPPALPTGRAEEVKPLRLRIKRSVILEEEEELEQKARQAEEERRRRREQEESAAELAARAKTPDQVAQEQAMRRLSGVNAALARLQEAATRTRREKASEAWKAWSLGRPEAEPRGTLSLPATLTAQWTGARVALRNTVAYLGILYVFLCKMFEHELKGIELSSSPSLTLFTRASTEAESFTVWHYQLTEVKPNWQALPGNLDKLQTSTGILVDILVQLFRV